MSFQIAKEDTELSHRQHSNNEAIMSGEGTPIKDASSLSTSGMDSSTFYSINDSGKRNLQTHVLYSLMSTSTSLIVRNTSHLAL